jgi:hypothetical protein
MTGIVGAKNHLCLISIEGNKIPKIVPLTFSADNYECSLAGLNTFSSTGVNKSECFYVV